MSEPTAELTPEQRADLEKERQCEALTADQPKLLQELVEELRRGKMKPYYPTRSPTAHEDGIRDIKEYFRRYKRMVSSEEYQRGVDCFERVNLEFLKRPASQHQAFPMYPPIDQNDFRYGLLCIKHEALPVLEGFTPRTGGRRARPEVQERNELIRRFKKEAPPGKVAWYVCCKLNDHEIPTPWPDEFDSWTKALTAEKAKRNYIHSMISRL